MVQEIFNRVRSQSDFRTVRGVVIVRHGTLVAETYFGDFTSTSLKNVHSVSKSVTSLAVGIAMDRGMLPSVDARLADLLPHYTHRLKEAPKDGITLRHALTMTAGLAWNETAGAFWNSPDSVDYVLTRDVAAQPGAEFFYSSGLSHVIAEVNNRASGPEPPGLRPEAPVRAARDYHRHLGPGPERPSLGRHRAPDPTARHGEDRPTHPAGGSVGRPAAGIAGVDRRVDTRSDRRRRRSPNYGYNGGSGPRGATSPTATTGSTSASIRMPTS